MIVVLLYADCYWITHNSRHCYCCWCTSRWPDELSPNGQRGKDVDGDEGQEEEEEEEEGGGDGDEQQ